MISLYRRLVWGVWNWSCYYGRFGRMWWVAWKVNRMAFRLLEPKPRG